MSSQIMLCVDLYAQSTIMAREIFELLLHNGWQLVHNGEIEHLPLGDKGMYDWTNSRMTTEEYLNLVDEQERTGDTIAAILYWENSGIGVTLQFFKEKELIFGMDVNKKYLHEDIWMLDFNWYAERILPCLQKAYSVQHYYFDYLH